MGMNIDSTIIFPRIHLKTTELVIALSISEILDPPLLLQWLCINQQNFHIESWKLLFIKK